MKFRSLAAIGMLLSLTLLFSCSKDNPTESTPTGPTKLILSPTSGTPLTQVTIDGVSEAQATDSNLVLYFDGHLAPVFVDSMGTVTSTIPIILDEATGWALDSTSISIALVNFKNNDTVAFGANVFALEHLDEASGATSQLQSDMSRIAGALHTIVPFFYDGEGEEEMISLAFMEALDSLVNNADTTGLAGAITKFQTDDPDGLALLDALIGVTGMNEQTSGYADIFENLASELAALRASKSAGTTTLNDEELAFRAQLYVVIRDFGQTVLGPTASTWGNLTGPIGIFVEIPLVAITGAALSLIDFVTNKLIVAMLPANIDYFIVSFASDTIALGDSTEAEYEIMMSNDPPGITVLDFIGQLLNGMGFSPSVSAAAKIKELDNLRKVLDDVFNYMMGIARSATQAYASAKPGLNLDPSIASISPMSWKASIEQSKFIELTSFTQNVIKPDPGGFNWVALGPNWDEGRVYARTTVDPGAIVIPQISGFTYSGGAFGEDVEKTDTKSVWVKPNLVMEMTMPQNVSEVSFEPMVIKAGYEIPIAPQPYRRTGSGAVDTVWSPDVQLDLQVVGGNAQSTTGTTNSNGEFTTGLALNGGSNRISVTTTGHGDVGTVAQVKESICAGSASTEPFGLTMGLPGARKSVPGIETELRVFTTYAGCVDVQLTAVFGTVSPTSVTTDADGHAYAGLTLPMDTDSMIVYATAIGTSGYMEYDTLIVHSYCLPEQTCSFGGSGFGSYTETGASCQSATITASASVGGFSKDDFRIEDPISVIAADSNLWGEFCIVWIDVNYTWSISGGSQTGNGIEAGLSSPGQYGFTFAAAGSGTDASDAGSAIVPVRGIPLAPWSFDSILGRFQVRAIPNPDVPNNTAISNSLTVQITGINRVTLEDGVTPVNVLCAQTASGLSYSSP